jgi:low affinity Fe/Cu permease
MILFQFMSSRQHPHLPDEARQHPVASPLPENHPPRESLLSTLANAAMKWTGSSVAFLIAVGAIAVWGISGPFFGFSDTWQLVINTGTTVVTFLMVFLIQRAQNKDSQAVHLKLNELIAAVNGASNRLINVERREEQDLQDLHENFEKLIEHTARDPNPTTPHSVEEASALPDPEA